MFRLDRVRALAIACCAIFLAGSMGLLIAGLMFPTFQTSSWVQTLSSVSIVILTLFYVIITSGQLEVMARQIEEMKQARELVAQPLLHLSLGKAVLQRPRLFYTPPDSTYSAQPRLSISFDVTNRGSHAAIAVDISGYLWEATNPQPFHASSTFCDALTEKEKLSSVHDDRVFFFVGEKAMTMLVSALRKDDIRSTTPILAVEILFKNTYGACFRVRQGFELRRSNDLDRDTLSNWHSVSTTFSTTYDREVNLLKSLRARSDDRWDNEFDSLKVKIESSLVGSDITLNPIQVSGSFSIRSISTEDYNEALESHSYPRYIPSWMEECFHIAPDITPAD
ncbi:hypothetical protein [Bradyrhizobium oligotrophicum]|uniref:hypothetical protein n=1 Tax=Bradyrhizobium oligotrophicum TaxID=44255 RepID=UPI003EB9B762